MGIAARRSGRDSLRQTEAVPPAFDDGEGCPGGGLDLDVVRRQPDRFVSRSRPGRLSAWASPIDVVADITAPCAPIWF